MKKLSSTAVQSIFITAVIIVVFVLVGVFAINTPKHKNAVPKSIKASERTYECDYRTLNVNTRIVFTENGKEYSIEGNIFTLLTDPLTLRDDQGNILGTADDSYHIVSQDDHAIVINGKFEVGINGNIEVFGNSYELYNLNGNKVGYAEFNEFGTAGGVYDADGNCIAVYSKSYFMNDYTVDIYNNNICSDKALLMLVASYVSDYHADN